MSKASDRLREVGFYNPHILAKSAQEHGRGKGIWIDYRPGDPGRWAVTAAWQVMGAGFKTDPDAHWTDYGNKTFLIMGSVYEERPQQLEVAIKWATKKYDLHDWGKVPGMGYAHFPGETVRWVADYLKVAGS